MKKVVVLIVALVVLLGLAVWFFAFKGKKNMAATPTPKPKLSLPENVIPVSERPYVMIEPTASREVIFSVNDLKKSAKSVDFELEYSSADKEDAAIGSLNFTGSPPYSKTILLGSQSGGGKITYHEGVTGGTLTLTFYDENYKLSNEWAYVDNRKPSTGAFGSRDGKFSIETAKVLKSAPFVIVYNNPGLPKNVDQALLAGPYSISVPSGLPTGKAMLTLRL